MIDQHPLLRLAPLLNGVEHANPIILSPSKCETRATEYSKAATRGNWNEVWDSEADKRKKVKTNDGPEKVKDADMFSLAGVVAK